MLLFKLLRLGASIFLPLFLAPRALAGSTSANLTSVVSVVNSIVVPGAYITFKQGSNPFYLLYRQTKICETTPRVKSYSGYVHLPPNAVPGQNYETHTFFWFFESRIKLETAPLSLWLQGGPGAPSTTSPIGENGPCSVNRDSASTELNPWSWSNRVNMLYVDQPVQVGFSYDSLVSGIVDEVKSPFAVKEVGKADDIRASNFTHPAGMFSSQNPSRITNTTGNAAEAMWHVMQVWMQEFPKYKSPNNTLSIWSESYGGHYGPIFADFFTKQNDKIASSASNSTSAKPLHIETVGIINGCIDATIQIPFYPEFAFNNTYGIQAYNETVYTFARQNIPACLNLTSTCSKLADEKDPGFKGNIGQVNKACQEAFDTCFGTVHAPYIPSLRNVFDIASPLLSSFPPKFAAGYLNREDVQKDLGVPLNFTGLSETVSQVFNQTGDFMRGNALTSLGRLLDKGVKISLIYGDRDYQCNWLGGEQIILSINSTTIPTSSFQKAGYAKIATNESYTGGYVRQLGNLSFARVFEAGHAVPYYQPETAYRIFERVMFDRDVATGMVETTAGYASTGLESAFALDGTAPELPPFGEEDRECYVWDILETCDKGQKALIGNGTAITRDFVMVGFRLHNGTEVLYSGKGTKVDGGDWGEGSPSPIPTLATAAPVQNSGGVGRYGLMRGANMVVVLMVVGVSCGGGLF